MAGGAKGPSKINRVASEPGLQGAASGQRRPQLQPRQKGRASEKQAAHVKLPSIHRSQSAPQPQLQQVGKPTPIAREGRREPDVESRASVASEVSQTRLMRRKAVEALTHPDVKVLAKRFYEAELPDRRQGRLGFKELKRALRHLNERLGVPMPQTQVAEQLFKRFDFNGDGSLSSDEFYELFVASLRRFAFDRSTLLSRDIFVSKERGKVWDNYVCLKKLGAGSFGAAYLCRHKRTGDERVVKAAGKSNVRLPVEDVEREIMVMMELDHPHLVRLYEWYEGSSSIYLVLDALTGGSLQEVILKRAEGVGISEDWIRTVTRQCTEAMAYCHSKRVIHKDLKDENIMLLKKDPEYTEPHAVIIDLGVSEMFDLSDPTGKSMGGTPATMAPEVWTGVFGPKCDVWSLGCVLFELLAGDVPFAARTLDPKDWRALHKHGPNWAMVKSMPMARDMCSQMLRFDERERPSFAACLDHKWYEQRNTLHAIPTQQFARLQKYCEESELKRAIVTEIASRLPLTHSDKVIHFFKALDENRDGAISKQELENGFKRVGLKAGTLWDRTFKALDVDGDGCLSLNEFAAGVVTVFSDLLEDRFRALFRKYDQDSNGILDKDEISAFIGASAHLLARHSKRSPQEIVHGIIGDCGGQLSYEDAKARLLNGGT
mmetsp:Transcript_69232/g.200559  ORF Transcript_69232/g.200559 Transcript_69232/m.200559 type:complete len:660 (-) Transcript_69232:48-2027(-)